MLYVKKLKNIYMFFTLIIVCSFNASGSVTIMGSRIIYPSNSGSVDVKLQNNDPFPYIIQAWFDDGDVNSVPEEKNKAPFIATPPLFRMQANSGQILRIVFNGDTNLPQDRESVFWFNTLQIPPSNIKGADKNNKMLVTLRTRMKVFYRPTTIVVPQNIGERLKVNATKNGIIVDNPHPWYVSISSIELKTPNGGQQLKSDMISPFSQQTFNITDSKLLTSGKTKVIITSINDLGAKSSETYDVTFP